MITAEQSVECELAGENRSTRRKPAPVQGHDLTRARTRAAATNRLSYGTALEPAWTL
jgi:hypothetical protein